MRLVIGIVLVFQALAAFASDFGDRYPSGSITDPARAASALRESDAEEARIGKDAAAREAECYKKFLVNRCRDAVRRDKLLAERELRRVRVEAHDLQRKLEAEDAARRRAESAAQGARPAGADGIEAPRPPREPQPGQPAPHSSTAMSPEEEARNRAEYEQRIADKQKDAAREQARAQERAESARKYKEKQAEAERRAQQKAADQKQTEARRAERRKQVQEQEALREEVRRRAEQAAKDAQK
jgi:colicin import membrane protein